MCPRHPIILSHRSAIEAWRSLRRLRARGHRGSWGRGDSTPPQPEYGYDPSVRKALTGLADRSDARPEAIAEALGLALPLHVMVNRNANHRSTRRLIRHRWLPALPPGSTVELIPGTLRLCTIEYALLQAASTFDRVSLALLAYEACGSYALADVGALAGAGRPALIDRIPPLVTIEAIREALTPARSLDPLRHNRRHPGSSRLRQALDSCLGFSASPAESKLALLMRSRRRDGGYRLPAPELNPPITPIGQAQDMNHARRIHPDFLWESRRRVVEYQGGEHADRRRIEEDAGRHNALCAMGYEVTLITRRQVNDPVVIEATLERLRHALGLSNPEANQEIVTARARLHGRLFGTGRDDPYHEGPF